MKAEVLTSTLRHQVKRTLGAWMPRYRPAREMLASLREVIPDFMAQPFGEGVATKRLLVASQGWYDAKTEAIYAKALEGLGYEVHVIAMYDPAVASIFELFGVANVRFYEDYQSASPLGELSVVARKAVADATEEQILEWSEEGARVGKYAASSVMRRTRESRFTTGDSEVRSLLIDQLTRSLQSARAARATLDEIQPDLLLVNDRGYSPVGELFDVCLERGIPALQRCGAHKGGWEVLKRYTSPEMSSVHHHSLSAASWDLVKSMPWGDERWEELHGELAGTYGSGDWFSEVGTQFNKVVYDNEELAHKLDLDPAKKTAIVFPHIFWDATFFWGTDLFGDYCDWFVNVLRVAAENRSLNWIIKIHPANLVKAKRDNYRGENVELAAVRKTLTELPDHIKVIPPESDINTFSLFGLMDFCLTVRGTIGIEAAAFGINTLTAGTGRYDRLGFTHDFDERDTYLKCLRSLSDIPPMTDEATQLARRFAYGAFLLRPIHLDLLETGYEQDEKATMKFRPRFEDRDGFEASRFVRELRAFVESGAEDYLDLRRVGYA